MLAIPTNRPLPPTISIQFKRCGAGAIHSKSRTGAAQRPIVVETKSKKRHGDITQVRMAGLGTRSIRSQLKSPGFSFGATFRESRKDVRASLFRKAAAASVMKRRFEW